LLAAVREKAKAIIVKINAQVKPTEKELNTLEKMAQTAIEAKQKELDLLKKQNEYPEYTASLEAWLNEQKEGITCLNSIKNAPLTETPTKGPANDEEAFFFTPCSLDGLTKVEPVNKETCNCLPVGSDCDEIVQILNKIKSANNSSKKIVVFTKNNLLNDYINDGVSSLSGINIAGNCYQLRIENKFWQESVNIDINNYQLDPISESIDLKDDQGNVAVSIHRLPNSTGSFQELLMYLGFAESKATPKNLKAKFQITGNQLKEIFKNTPQNRCNEVAEVINKYSTEYGIDTAEKMSHFIGQIGAETQLKNLDESSYSASRILTAEKTRTIRTHNGKKVLKYCSIFEGNSAKSSGCPYPYCDEDIVVPEGSYSNGYASEAFMKGVRKTVKPQMVDELPRDPDFFNTVYACLLDNDGIASGDGYRFRGRGFIQITGQTNYQTMVQDKWNQVHKTNKKDFMCRSAACDQNLDTIANDLDFSMLISLTFWKAGNTSELAKKVNKESIENVTYSVNGAYIGLPNRKLYTNKAYEVFKN
jgi:predicted chitinase